MIESPVKLNVPMWEGAQRLQCKSELAQCSEKTTEPLRGGWGGGAGLKFEEKNAGTTIKSTTKKKLGISSPVFCTFHSPPTQ